MLRMCSIIFALLMPVQAAWGAQIYTYTGQPFGIEFNGQNLLPGATNITVRFASATPLAPSTLYDTSSSIFGSMSMSDGVDVIAPGLGSFLPSSFVATDSSGNITAWIIAELLGPNRSFVLGNLCCTIGDVPVLLTYNPMGYFGVGGSTDASIATNGFFGVGPTTDYAFNNLSPGTWTSAIPEPGAWSIFLAGLVGTVAMLRIQRRKIRPVPDIQPC